MKNNSVVTITLNPAIDETVLIENFAAGEVNRVLKSEQHPGGKGINVSAFVADYGVKVCSTGFLGNSNDSIFISLFNSKDITDRCIRISGQTRIGIKISDPVKNQTTDINYPGITPLDDDIRLLFKTVEELAADHEWFVISGSIPAGVDSAIYAKLIALLKKKDRRIILDTSGEAFSLAVKSLPDVIKPNLRELSEYSGKELTTHREIIEVAKSFLDAGIKLVIVSMGENGALFIDGNMSLLATPPRINVKSTVGAGDAMVSGALCGIIQSLPLDQTARLATAFSMTAVMNIIPGIPDRNDLPALTGRVKIESL